MTIEQLPAVNAGLNAAATLLIITGLIAIKVGARDWHKRLMLAAIGVSAAFLTCYLIYHFNVVGVTKFTTGGLARAAYMFILLTHIPLAVLVLPLLWLTVLPAIRGDYERHRRWAKVTVPTWLYVSVTGVLVYLLLYVWFPGARVG
jgi:putative membrane protein